MSNFTIEGTLHKKGERETKNNFTFRELVLKVMDGAYEQHISFQLSNDRCDLLDSFSPGDTLTVHFNIRGRLWQDKCFNTLTAWKLAKTGQAPVSEAAFGGGAGNGSQGQEVGQAEPVNSELPF